MMCREGRASLHKYGISYPSPFESGIALAPIRLISALLMLALMFGAASASAQEGACARTVENALWAIPEHCADLGRDSLCAGHAQVDVSFAGDAAKWQSLSPPSQRASAADLAGVRTSGLESEHGDWGVAALHLGANFPRTYEGPGILLLLAGAAQVRNEVDPAAAVEFGEPLSTAALVDTTRFKKPGIIPAPLAQVAADEILLVDAFDSSGDWLRVVNDGQISWVAADDAARLTAMEALPRIGVGAPFPFQALSLSTDTAYPECEQAEPFIALQMPADRPVNLSVNGVDIHIGAMVTFQQVHRNALSMTVHRGEATTVFGHRMRPGETVIGILGTTPERDLEVLDWSGALPASEAELARGLRAQEALNGLAAVNGWPAYLAQSQPPEVMHVVEAGDSLYSIARLYETSVADIILANLGDEPLRLYRGIKLIVPNPGSGFAGRGDVPLNATLDD